MFYRLVKERALEFDDIKDKIDPNNLVYNFKTSENEPKDIGNYQMPLKLFEDLKLVSAIFYQIFISHQMIAI